MADDENKVDAGVDQGANSGTDASTGQPEDQQQVASPSSDQSEAPAAPAPTEAVPENTTAARGTPVAGPSLEQQRDLRVVPVAQSTIEVIAGQNTAVDVNDRSEFTNVILSILQKSLDADLNIVTDVPYIFQLILSVYSAFNTVALAAKKPDVDMARFSKIAHEMMGLLASAKAPMGDGVKPEDQVTALEGIKPQLEELFSRENITQLELSYILESLMHTLKVTNDSFQQQIQRSVDRAEAKVWRLDDFSDLTLKKLDKVLQTSMDDLVKEGSMTDPAELQ